MKVLCSWCGDTIREDVSIENNSHGICGSCNARFVVKATLRQVKTVAETVHSQVVITCDNKKHEQLITSGIVIDADIPVGEALQCKNSDLDDGCGTTRFCGKCKLRACLENALSTGATFKHIEIPFNSADLSSTLIVSIFPVDSHLELRVHNL